MLCDEGLFGPALLKLCPLFADTYVVHAVTDKSARMTAEACSLSHEGYTTLGCVGLLSATYGDGVC